MTRALTTADRLDWLQLARSGGVGPKTFFKLLRRFGNPRRAYEELPRLVRDLGGEQRYRRCRRDEAEGELRGLEEIGALLLVFGEPTYPERLAGIADPPPVIAVRGRAGDLARPGVAVVGARNASANGRLFAGRLAGQLAEAGLVVISGLARGIDTAAHQGALEAGGGTVAVLASGIDVAYPPDNAELMARIVDAGAVVSERPLGSEPQARHFPRRNRLIAGLCLGVVVVEAAPQSGSLITARLAAEQGRDVMAVPGSPLDPRHRGTNQLLRDGATLIESADDVVAALGPAMEGAPAPRVAPPPVRPVEDGSPALPPEAPVPDDGVAARVCRHLGPEPLLVDELIRQCDAGAALVQHALLELELDGRVERHPGNRVSLASG